MKKINKKGFTLIELLAVIILLSLILTLIIPSIVSSIKKGKDTSYKIFIDNIKVAAENYYIECENNDAICSNNPISNNQINTTLEELAKKGFLKSTTLDNTSNTVSTQNVLDPRDNTNLNDCKIIVTKNKEGINTTINGKTIKTTKVTYSVTNGSSNPAHCPSSY